LVESEPASNSSRAKRKAQALIVCQVIAWVVGNTQAMGRQVMNLDEAMADLSFCAQARRSDSGSDEILPNQSSDARLPLAFLGHPLWPRKQNLCVHRSCKQLQPTCRPQRVACRALACPLQRGAFASMRLSLPDSPKARCKRLCFGGICKNSHLPSQQWQLAKFGVNNGATADSARRIEFERTKLEASGRRDWLSLAAPVRHGT
jgi:hypothetical protein